MCEERVVPCRISQEACVADCQNWDRANQLCVVQSRRCIDVNACFGDPEGQQLCRRTCDYLQECLEEACPPRSIPPTVTDGCTAGCLDDPPSAQEADDWEALSCREIREFVYRGNRELRPICEGGRDFRPTPEECVAFCDNALGDCLGVGGRNFCLAGCASLTRDQYGCALEAQGNCEVIDRCLVRNRTIVFRESSVGYLFESCDYSVLGCLWSPKTLNYNPSKVSIGSSIPNR